LRNNETYDEEEKEWEVIESSPYQTFEEKWIVCIDTMGQDRELTDEQKRFALSTVQKYKDIWEKVEQENLT